jgi:hypothetical protein
VHSIITQENYLFLTVYLLMWKIQWVSNDASKCQM